MNTYIGSINNVLRSLIIYYIQILEENDEDITAAIAEGFDLLNVLRPLSARSLLAKLGRPSPKASRPP